MQYSDGVLCYMQQDSVRILDVHGASQTEDVIDMRALMAELPEYDPDTPINAVGYILGYENGILTMSAVYSGSLILVVIDVRKNIVSTTQNPSRIRQILRPSVPYHRTQVITDGRYLVWAHAPVNVPEWTLKCYDLSEKDGSASVIALHEFLPTTRECRFQILDGWFYAICVDEEGPFNLQRDGKKKLYYNCCRFPIDDFAPAPKPEDFLGPSTYTPLPARLQAVQLLRGIGRVARKQSCHHLVKDERSGDLFIVESAHTHSAPESDEPYRRIIFPDPKKDIANSWKTTISEIVQTEEEYPPSSDHYVHRTSFPIKAGDVRKHIQPSQSIIDVRHEYLGERSYQQVLHLYARSTDRKSWRFPPQSAPHELRDFLSVSGVEIATLADERSLIILTCDRETHETPTRNDQLILVNFDSAINFPNFRYLALENLSDKVFADGKVDVTGAIRSKQMRKLQVELLQLNEEARREAEAHDARKAEAPVAHPWFSNEPAMHQSIGQGFQFYPPKPTAG